MNGRQRTLDIDPVARDADIVALHREDLSPAFVAICTKDKDGICWRSFGVHIIAGRVFTLYERATGCWVDVDARDATSPPSGESMTQSEWDSVVEKATKYMTSEAEKLAKLEEAKRFGISCSDVVIVRCTRTRWVDSTGGRWVRSSGKKVGGYRWERLRPTHIAAIELVAAGRENVDFVAERKASLAGKVMK